jgi:hypothetical protein
MTAKSNSKSSGEVNCWRTGNYIFSGDRAAGWRDLTPKLFLRIQLETLLVPIVLIRKELLRSPARVGFSTSDGLQGFPHLIGAFTRYGILA